jgi:hypothetical protein
MQRRFLILPVAVAVGLAAELAGFGWGDPGHWVPDLAVGWCLIGCGFVASTRRPESRSGVLMSATGFTWFLGNFAGVGATVVAWASAHALFLHRGPLFQLLLTYPGGRGPSRVTRAAIAVFYAAAVITPVWQNEAAAILLAALLLGVCGYDCARMVGPPRRMRLIALRAAAVLSLVLAASAVADLLVAPAGASLASLLAYEVALVVIAGMLVAGLLLGPGQGAAVTDLVVQLGQARSWTLREELSRAMGDPTLEVGYWLPGAATFVDANGGGLSLPDPGSGRSATVVEREGRPAAVLIHDRAVLSDPVLLEAAAGAARHENPNPRPRPGSRPPTRGFMRRCGPRSPSSRRHAAGFSTRAILRASGSSAACTTEPRADSENWRRPCAGAANPRPVSRPGTRWRAVRTSSQGYWTNCASWRWACIPGPCPSVAWPGRWPCWPTARPSRWRSG